MKFWSNKPKLICILSIKTSDYGAHFSSRFDYKGIKFLYFIYVIINSIAQGNAFMVWWFGNT